MKKILAILLMLTISQMSVADELVHKFKSPSFSGIGQSSHYLTIENQEFSRKQAIAEDGTETQIVIPIGAGTAGSGTG